ncbi:hypothetical protein [Pseudomonas mucidolens]|uniref:hypothetical protein n=1 Tax=Pseudomonas mucidolens TaxID=46679 RepID=UPI0030DC2183
MYDTVELHPGADSPRQEKHGTLALDPMHIPGIDPDDPRGLIPVTLMSAPLHVEIPMWNPEPEPLDSPHILMLHWRRGGFERVVDQCEIVAPPPPLPDIHVMHVPQEILREQSGTVELYYSVTDSFGNPSFMDPKVLTVDMDRPLLVRPEDRLQFDVEPVPVMDEQYLLDHPQVAFHLPVYNVRADKDRIEFRLSNIPNPPPSGPVGEYTLASSNDPLVVYLGAEAFRTLVNGDAYIFYRVFDEAGNYSDRSAGLAFQLALKPLPGVLPKPQIAPPAYDDSLIKRDDARAGVFVRITEYANWAPGDQVLVYWKGRAAPIQEVTGFPFDVEIPWSVLRGPLTDPLVAESVPVHYEIIRDNLPPFRSFAILVDVNLTVAGQDHVDAPALLNANLPVAEIWGITSNLQNVVNHDDNPAGARARVVLYENPLPGHVLGFFWNGIGPVASYTVQAGDVEGQLVFSTVIPWAVMEGIINPALPVYYTTSNGVNEQQANNTLVNVNTGALISFRPPVLGHTLTGPAGYLSCCSKPEIFYGVTWQIAPDERFELNDEVHFFWEGYISNNWEPPALEESKFQQVLIFDTHDKLEKGLDVVVEPYEDRVVPMRDYGSASASYKLRRGGSLIGESVPKRIRIDLTYAGSGDYCKAGDIISCSTEGVATLEERKEH